MAGLERSIAKRLSHMNMCVGGGKVEDSERSERDGVTIEGLDSDEY